jgi:hypothetical protein
MLQAYALDDEGDLGAAVLWELRYLHADFGYESQPHVWLKKRQRFIANLIASFKMKPEVCRDPQLRMRALQRCYL